PSRGVVRDDNELTHLSISGVRGPVVQLETSVIELHQVHGHVVDESFGLNRLQRLVLPRPTNLGVPAVEPELRQLLVTGVTQKLPTGPQGRSVRVETRNLRHSRGDRIRLNVVSDGDIRNE